MYVQFRRAQRKEQVRIESVEVAQALNKYIDNQKVISE
jgi:hypothetical protein